MPYSRPSRSRGTRLAALSIVGGLVLTTVAAAPMAQAEPSDTQSTTVAELDLAAIPQSKSRAQSPSSQSSGRDASAPPEESTGDAVVSELDAKSVDEFTSVGVTWSKADGDPGVEIKTRTAGVWTDWTTLADSVDEADSSRQEADGPDGAEAAGARLGTDPLFVGSADGIEVRMTAEAGSRVVDPQVALISSPVLASDRQLASSAAKSSRAGQPSIVSRASWGANESWRTNQSGCRTPRINSTISAAIVHHTAGSNSYSAAQSASIVRGVYAYHTKSQGWCDVGYNFLVDKYGTTFEGRYGGIDKPVHGAHATSWNTDTVGVSMMGNYESTKPSKAALESVAKVIAWKFARYDRDPLGKVTLAGKYMYRISGHGDVMSTSCPGRNVRSQFPAMRKRVKALMGQAPPAPTPAPVVTPIYKRWVALGGAKGTGSSYSGEETIKDGYYAQFRSYDLFSSKDTGAFFTKGTIRKRYRALGTANSRMGFPTTDEVDGPTSKSKMNRFERGAILWSHQTSAHEVRGGIWKTYDSTSRIDAKLGLPLAPEYDQAAAGNVPVQDFENGRMYWINDTGYLVYGRIWTEYQRIGAEKSALGRPISSEETGPLSGTRQTRFANGAILHSRANGSKAVTGAFWGSYRKLSSSNTKRLGLPASSEYTSGAYRMQKFQGGTMSRKSGSTSVKVSYS